MNWLPADHLARFIAELVDEHLDLSRITATYTEGRGGPPYDPRLMVRILLHGCTTGVRSSRKLETACVDVVAFRWLAAGSAPDYRAIARFRKRHLSALGHQRVRCGYLVAGDRTSRCQHRSGAGRMLADAGCCSADNLDRAAEPAAVINHRL